MLQNILETVWVFFCIPLFYLSFLMSLLHFLNSSGFEVCFNAIQFFKVLAFNSFLTNLTHFFFQMNF